MKRLTLPYPPSLNNLYLTIRGGRVLSPEGRSYKKHVAVLARGVTKTLEPVAITIDVYRPRKAGDLDNSLKVVLDSFTGIAYSDDWQFFIERAGQFRRTPARRRICFEI